MTKQIDKEIIAKLLDSPNAPALLEEVKLILDEEKKRRLQFYDDITEQEKVEFINGEIIIHSPVKKMHNEVCGNAYKIIDTFVVENKLGFVGVEKILIQLTRNDYEPDICFFNNDNANQFNTEQSLFPAPNFIIEVLSKGTESRDRGIKFEDYQNHGVKEYWIVDPKKKTVEQYVLKRKSYELVLKSNTGEIKSVAIKNLKFSIKSMFDSQLANQELKRFLK